METTIDHIIDGQPRTTTANMVLPKAGLNSFDWTFVQGSTFVLRLDLVLQIPTFGNTQTVGRNSTKTHLRNKICRNIFSLEKFCIFVWKQ